MKKTIIAAALAATTGVAMADVSVSGRVEQGFQDTDGVTSGWAGYTDNQIHFNASEDLGNGMTAFSSLSLKNGGELNEKVGLKGSFGTIVAGRMEDFTEGKLAATQSTMGTNMGELSGNATRVDATEHALAYVSPSINGLTVGVAGIAATTEGDNFDATDVMVAYSNGPLTLMAARESMGATTATALSADTDKETDSFSVQYGMGDLSVAALLVGRTSSAGVESDDTMVRLDYKMGANKITLQHANDDSANNDINIVELSHSFSKRTAVYVGASDGDTDATSTAYAGIQHTF